MKWTVPLPVRVRVIESATVAQRSWLAAASSGYGPKRVPLIVTWLANGSPSPYPWHRPHLVAEAAHRSRLCCRWQTAP